MPAYATVDDYDKRHGPLIGEVQLRRVEAKLVDASAMIRNVLPVGYTPDAELTRALCVAVAYRAITNPGGARSRTVGQVATTYDQDGGLYLTVAEERMLLAQHEADQGSGAYTITLRDEAFDRHHHGCGW